MPICVGKGTKVSSILTETDKEYIAKLVLGISTDTQDHTGTIIKEQKVSVSKEQIHEVVKSFIGEYNQIPPMYSAIKINGKKLYELARQGIEIERKSRIVKIHGIDILDINNNEIELKVKCSKGTYIRTLCNDIGEKIGCGGHMSTLIRSKVGRFDITEKI